MHLWSEEWLGVDDEERKGRRRTLLCVSKVAAGRGRSSVIGLWTESHENSDGEWMRVVASVMAGEKAPDPKVMYTEKGKRGEVDPWRSHRSKLVYSLNQVSSGRYFHSPAWSRPTIAFRGHICPHLRFHPTPRLSLVFFVKITYGTRCIYLD